MDKPSGFTDACCRPAWGAHNFMMDPEDKKRALERGEELPILNRAEALVLLKFNQAGIVTLQVIQLVLLVLWQIAAVVPGFARFDGAAGEVSAVSHLGWWSAIELFTLYIGGISVYFGLHYSRNGRIQKGVVRMRSYLAFYMAVLVGAMLANVAHTVLCGLEIANCTSTLCTLQRGFLIALIALLVTLSLLEAWLIYRVAVYRTNMWYILGAGLEKFIIADVQNGGGDEEMPEPSLRPTGESLRAPLLAEVMTMPAPQRMLPVGAARPYVHRLRTPK